MRHSMTKPGVILKTISEPSRERTGDARPRGQKARHNQQPAAGLSFGYNNVPVASRALIIYTHRVMDTIPKSHRAG